MGVDGGGSDFTTDEVTALKALVRLSLLQTSTIPLSINTQSNSTYDINSQNVILLATKDENGVYDVAQDVNDFNGDGNVEEFLLNINRICMQCRKL